MFVILLELADQITLNNNFKYKGWYALVKVVHNAVNLEVYREEEDYKEYNKTEYVVNDCCFNTFYYISFVL